MSQTVIVAGGCFWGVEKAFRRKFPQITKIEVGYCGGSHVDVDYRKVCSGLTGHAEVVKFEIDENLEYEAVLEYFYRMHDPTTANSQGNDKGTQYRSTIFYESEYQRLAATRVTAEMNKIYGGKIATTIEKVLNYVSGEEYHQDYLQKNPAGYECPTHFERSIESIKMEFGRDTIWT